MALKPNLNGHPNKKNIKIDHNFFNKPPNSIPPFPKIKKRPHGGLPPLRTSLPISSRTSLPGWKNINVFNFL